MAFDWVELVRLVHILGAVLWAGGGAFALLILGPAVRDAGPAGQGFMKAMAARGGPARIMTPVAGLTLLTGGVLYWQRGYWRGPFGSLPTSLLTVAAAIGLFSFLVGVLYGMPMQKRMAATAAQVGPAGPTPEQKAGLEAMGARMKRISTTFTWLIVLALVLMVGRNVFA